MRCVRFDEFAERFVGEHRRGRQHPFELVGAQQESQTVVDVALREHAEGADVHAGRQLVVLAAEREPERLPPGGDLGDRSVQVERHQEAPPASK
jgi:hypothetical protein